MQAPAPPGPAARLRVVRDVRAGRTLASSSLTLCQDERHFQSECTLEPKLQSGTRVRARRPSAAFSPRSSSCRRLTLVRVPPGIRASSSCPYCQIYLQPALLFTEPLHPFGSTSPCPPCRLRGPLASRAPSGSGHSPAHSEPKHAINGASRLTAPSDSDNVTLQSQIACSLAGSVTISPTPTGGPARATRREARKEGQTQEGRIGLIAPTSSTTSYSTVRYRSPDS